MYELGFAILTIRMIQVDLHIKPLWQTEDFPSAVGGGGGGVVGGGQPSGKVIATLSSAINPTIMASLSAYWP